MTNRLDIFPNRISCISMKIVGILSLVMLVSFNLQSQSLLDINRNKVVLKWAPLPLFDYYNTLQLGVEIPFRNDRFTFMQELGYGHSSFNVWFYEGAGDRPDRHNFRSRSQIRYYIKEWNAFRLFLAGEYFLRRSRTLNIGYTGVGCDGGFGCDYLQENRYTTERLANALHFKFGFQSWLSERICLDVYTGLGLRTTRSRLITPGIETWRDKGPWWEISDWGTGRAEPMPSLAIGFQLGIRLGKNKF